MTAIPLPRLEGKYEILEKLREGGMGAIYKVRHRLLDEERVIKLMRPQLIENEDLKARFLREARLAIKLRHPNIAQLYDFTIDEESGTAFIVMELIHGTTLEDLLAVHGPPPLGLALEIARQSLKALAYLHAKGFIHRDISPDNLMLTEDLEGGPLVKLIDLGIAKILGTAGEGSLTHTGVFLGKVRYASPEQFGSAGSSRVDLRGDLYSFGLVLYELLTGRYPIEGEDPPSLLAGHLFRPPLGFEESDPGGRVPEGLRAIVLQALAKDPADRPADALEMVRALAPFRRPDDMAGFDLQRVLSAPAAPAREETVPIPGSTQQRLDEQFGLSKTPRPRHLEIVPAEPAAPPAAKSGTVPIPHWARALDPGHEDAAPRERRERDREIGALLAEARRLLGAGEVGDAIARIRKASRIEPGHREVRTAVGEFEEALRRLEQERRRREEETAHEEDVTAPRSRNEPVPPESPMPLRPVIAPGLPRRWIGAGAAIGFVLLLGLWMLPDHEPAIDPPVPLALEPVDEPSTAGTGTLEIRADPWGEIVEILDENDVPQPLGGRRYVPLTLTLPAGRYKVTLRNGSFPRPVTLEVEVLAGAAVRSVAKFSELTGVSP